MSDDTNREGGESVSPTEAVGNIIGGVTSSPGELPAAAWSLGSQLPGVSTLTDSAGALAQAGSFLLLLTQPATWVRVGLVLAGVGLGVAGIMLIVGDVTDAPQRIEQAADTAVKARTAGAAGVDVPAIKAGS